MKAMMVLGLALLLSACAGTDSPVEMKASDNGGIGAAPPPVGAQPLSSVGSIATVVIKNITVGQIRRLATGDGVAAIGSADLTISCVITAVDAVECAPIPGVPQ